MKQLFKDNLIVQAHTVLKGTHLLYLSMLLGVALNKLEFIRDDRFNPFFNGLIYIIIIFGVLLSLTSFSFDNLSRKSILQYHMGSLLLKTVILLLFVLMNMLSHPPFIYLFIVGLFYLGSFAFDKNALKDSEGYNESALQTMVDDPKSLLPSKTIDYYKHTIMYVYRILCMFTFYILVIMILRQSMVYQGIALSILLIVIVYHHVKFIAFNLVPQLHIIAHGIFQAVMVIIQYSFYHLFIMRNFLINGLLILLSIVVLLGYTLYIRTKLKNHDYAKQVTTNDNEIS